MGTMVLEQTSPSNAMFLGFSEGTVGSEIGYPEVITDLKEKFGLLTVKLSSFFIDEPWSYEKNDTAEAIPSTNLLVFDDYIDEIESPVMPPKKEFRVELIIRSIERGKPSICDDYEIW